MIAHGLPLVPDGAHLVANGKQALSLVAQDLRARGVRTLLVPDFHCLTMIEPFQLEGIDVRHVATDDRALLDARALREALAVGPHRAVLHCEMYGARATAPLREALAGARSTGVPVVVDATHAVFTASHDPHDYLVASLRKLLPLPDGAFVTGIADPAALDRRAVDEEATRLALEAERRRGDCPDGACSQAEYLSAVDAAEEAMLEAREPVDMSPLALRRLVRLDVETLLAARMANARHLIRRLTASGFEVLNEGTPECGVVVRVDDATTVERRLLAAGIICPISWPRPAGLTRGAPWRTDWITLPVEPGMSSDQRDRSASIVEHHVPSDRAAVTAG